MRTLTCLLTLFAVNVATADTRLPPITEVKAAATKPDVFKVAKRGAPIEVKSAEDATKYFTKDGLKAIEKSVDFEKQVVLVFAWRGSGQDKLLYDVLESFPEQLVFRIQPGRTRDLRPHVHVYAVRSNVKWKVGKGR